MSKSQIYDLIVRIDGILGKPLGETLSGQSPKYYVEILQLRERLQQVRSQLEGSLVQNQEISDETAQAYLLLVVELEEAQQQPLPFSALASLIQPRLNPNQNPNRPDWQLDSLGKAPDLGIPKLGSMGQVEATAQVNPVNSPVNLVELEWLQALIRQTVQESVQTSIENSVQAAIAELFSQKGAELQEIHEQILDLVTIQERSQLTQEISELDRKKQLLDGKVLELENQKQALLESFNLQQGEHQEAYADSVEFLNQYLHEGIRHPILAIFEQITALKLNIEEINGAIVQISVQEAMERTNSQAHSFLQEFIGRLNAIFGEALPNLATQIQNARQTIDADLDLIQKRYNDQQQNVWQSLAQTQHQVNVLAANWQTATAEVVEGSQQLAIALQGSAEKSTNIIAEKFEARLTVTEANIEKLDQQICHSLNSIQNLDGALTQSIQNNCEAIATGFSQVQAQEHIREDARADAKESEILQALQQMQSQIEAIAKDSQDRFTALDHSVNVQGAANEIKIQQLEAALTRTQQLWQEQTQLHDQAIAANSQYFEQLTANISSQISTQISAFSIPTAKIKEEPILEIFLDSESEPPDFSSSLAEMTTTTSISDSAKLVEVLVVTPDLILEPELALAIEAKPADVLPISVAIPSEVIIAASLTDLATQIENYSPIHSADFEEPDVAVNLEEFDEFELLNQFADSEEPGTIAEMRSQVTEKITEKITEPNFQPPNLQPPDLQPTIIQTNLQATIALGSQAIGHSPQFIPQQSWILGIDFGGSTLRATLYELHSDRLIRLTALPIANSNITHFKQFLKAALPYPENDAWQPSLQWSSTQTLSLRELVSALTNLLIQVKNLTKQVHLPNVLQKLDRVVMAHPGGWSNIYAINLRESALAAGLVESSEQILIIDQAIAPLFPIIKNQTLKYPTLLIDAGAESTSLALMGKAFKQNGSMGNGAIATKSFDYAGSAITQDVFTQLIYPRWRNAKNPARDTCNLNHLSLPRLGTPDPGRRAALQQYLWEIPTGRELWQLAESIKVELSANSVSTNASVTTEWTSEILGYPLVISQREVENQILQLFVQRLNYEVNGMLATAKIAAIEVAQVLVLGNSCQFELIDQWLQQKFPNSEFRPLLPNTLVDGLAIASLYKSMLNLPMHQYSDYFLLHEICRLNLKDACSAQYLMQQLRSQGINVNVCQERIMSILRGDITSQLFPWLELSEFLLIDKSMLELAKGHLFEVMEDGSYLPNVLQFQRLRDYLQKAAQGLRQNLGEPLVFSQISQELSAT